MASQWFYKAHADHERPNAKRGPVSFQQLAQLVVDGELTSDSVACRETGEDWQSVGQIVGLRRLVDKISSRFRDRSSTPQSDGAATTHPETLVTATSDPALDQHANAGEKPNHWPPRLALGLASVLVVLFLVGWWIRPRWERFPKPARFQNTQHVSGWHFPLIGRVSGLEFGLLVLDVAIVLMMMIWWMRHRAARKRRAGDELR